MSREMTKEEKAVWREKVRVAFAGFAKLPTMRMVAADPGYQRYRAQMMAREPATPSPPPPPVPEDQLLPEFREVLDGVLAQNAHDLTSDLLSRAVNILHQTRTAEWRRKKIA